MVGVEDTRAVGRAAVGGHDDRRGRGARSQARQLGPQIRQDRVDDRVVRRDVDVDAPGQPVLGVDDRDRGVHLVGRARDHRLVRRRVHRHGQSVVAGDQLVGGVGVELEQRHRALPGQPLHQPRPGRDHLQPVGGAQRAGHHRGGDLTHRMADHRIGGDSVGPPQRGQCELHTDQHRLDPVDADHRLPGGQHVAQGEAHLSEEVGFELVDGGGESGFVGEQPLTHAGPLRALPGVEEHRAGAQRRIVRADHARGRVPAGERAQPGDGLVAVRGDDGREPGVLGAAMVERVGDVGQADPGGLRALQPVGEPAGQRCDARRGLTADHQRADRWNRLRRRAFQRFSHLHRRRLLDHDVRVGAADTERGHRGPARTLQGRPVQMLGGDAELRRAFTRLRGQLLEVQLARDLTVVHRQHGLDEPGDARGRLQVAEVGLHRTEHQRCGILAVAVHGRERIEFDRVAQRRAGAVRLDVVDVRRLQPGRLQRLAHQLLLSRAVGHRLPAAGAVLVDRRTADHGEHPVTVAQRIGEPLEHDHAGALAADVAVGVGVEGLAQAVRGQHAPARAGDVVLRRQDQVHARGQRVVALAAAQALTGQMDRHQRRRARGVADDRRAAYTQEVGQPACGEVRRVAERDVRVDVLGPQLADDRVVVVVGRQADEHTGRRTTQRARVDPGVLQRLPGDLEQKPLLRVHRGRLTGRDREELGVEFVGLPRRQEAALAVADGAGHRVVGRVVLVGVPPVGGHPDDAVAAVGQEPPERVGVLDARRQPAADADHRDRFGLGLLGGREAGRQVVDLAERLGDDRPAIRRCGGT